MSPNAGLYRIVININESKTPKHQGKAKMAQKDKGGRPTAYLEVYNEQARKLCLMGYTDVELAEFFGVCERTLNNWKKEHPAFLQSLKDGKENADAEVTVGLYERAKGYQHVETKVFNNNGEIVTYDVVKKYPPDPLAIKYWLNNRQPKRWREKVEQEVGSESNQVNKIQIEVVNAHDKD